MTLSDKIMDLFQRYGALSSERVTYLLKTEFRIARGHRTAQRHIARLVKEGKLVLLPPSGREQMYSILKDKPQVVSDYFLGKFWDELFKIRDIIHDSKEQYIDSRGAFLRLRSLVKMLPKNLKDSITPSIEDFFNLDHNELAKLQEQWDREVGSGSILTVCGVPFGKTEQKRHDRAMNLINRAFRIKLETLIDRVSTVVHQELERESNE